MQDGVKLERKTKDELKQIAQGLGIEKISALKKDEIISLYRKTLSAKKMLANRNPDIPMYLEKYEKWKNEANKFKKDIKQGLRTEEEFLKWIEETRKK